MQNLEGVVRGQLHVGAVRHLRAGWIVLLVAVAVFVVADRFTVAGLGQDITTNVGVNYHRVVLLGTGLIAVATGVVTVVVGNLPFLGLIVPNVVSMIRETTCAATSPGSA